MFLSRLYFLILPVIVTVSSCCNNSSRAGIASESPYWGHFIAHAGGSIDGINYTNSLEALELSYSKGCKMFELDLVLTADGKIVASRGILNKTEAEFMAQRIAGKYTPMNMESINLWFENHPDAILVTDKFDDPERIYEEFLFVNRLIMELFTWEAIDKAIELGIKPMVTEKLFFGTSNIETVLKDKKIEYISMNYKRIFWNKKLLKKVKKAGVKNYVFNLELPIRNQPAEQYIWKHKMKFCYGIYANDLDILKPDSLNL